MSLFPFAFDLSRKTKACAAEKKIRQFSFEISVLMCFYIINILMMTALRMVWIFLTSDTPQSPSTAL